MGKFIVRASIVIVAVYLIAAFLCAQLFGEDILYSFYCLPFELCVVVYAFSEGRYHCKYIKYTAVAILLADTLTHLDNVFDFLSIEAHNIIPIGIIVIGILIGIILAIKHYIRVIKLKRNLNGRDFEN
jgi:hypothetical protein